MSVVSKVPVAPPAQLSPRSSAAAPVYRFGPFRLNVAARTLTRDGQPVALGTRATGLLIALVANPDRIVSKQELVRIAWPNSTVVENNLAVAICTLRRAFDGLFYVRNEYGKGYRFVAPVWTEDAAVAAEPTRTEAEHPGIAVLPFVDVGGHRDEDVFGHGVAEEIIAALSSHRWLRVTARNSSFSYPAEPAALGQVARELGVRYVIAGTVRRDGDRVRVTARLTDAASDAVLVSERHDRVIGDLFAVQDEIARRIVAAVRSVVLEAERERSFRTPPESLDAWLACQRGFWHQGQWTPDDLRQSMHWFGRAMQIAPRYAPAYYGLSRAVCWAGSGYSPVAPPDWQAEGERLAREAVKLDPRDSDSHTSLSFARYMRGDHAGAILAAETALARNASNAHAYTALGMALVFSGRPAEGIDALHACIDLDPRDPRVYVRQMQIGLGLYFMDDMEAAGAHAATMLHAWPQYTGSHRLQAMVLAETGQPAAALAALERAVALSPRPFDDFSHARMPWYRAADFRRVLAGFRRAGWQGRGG